MRNRVVALLLLSLSPCVTAHAAWTLKYHFDKSSNSTTAEIVSGAAGQLAVTTCSHQLPVGYTQDLSAELVPLLVLARLRDDLADNSGLESSEARDWLVAQMGPYATIPTNIIPGNMFASLVLTTIETSTWCGDETGIDHRCIGDCLSPCGVAGPTACCECACVGHAVWVEE